VAEETRWSPAQITAFWLVLSALALLAVVSIFLIDSVRIGLVVGVLEVFVLALAAIEFRRLRGR
jgi:uncharacterized membrane protein